MAKFIFKKLTRRFIIQSAQSMVLTGANGLPTVVQVPSKVINITDGTLDTKEFVKRNPQFTEEEIIERIHKDTHFGTEEIQEVTEADLKAMEIKNRHMKEAEKEVNEWKEKNKK